MPWYHNSSRREFIIRAGALPAALAGSAVLSACGGGDDPIPAFDFGVASGDPLADRVILWNHARFPGTDAPVDLIWEVATDASFGQIVANGNTQASASRGFTAKVDAAGLQPGKDYFYRFRYGSYSSPVGRTRTLPASGAQEVRLAVFSCSNYPAGFFHAYAEAARSQAQYAVHLGDYIYEYGANGYATADATRLGRVSQPATECLTLQDYRQRYAQYRSDPDAKALHAAMPMIAIWDDHETANDAYRDGAQNHTEGAEGRWVDRRAAAVQAWHEWMPVRTPNLNDLLQIYRSFDFGGLMALHMLETRLLARDKQIAFAELLNPATAASAQAALISPNRTMLGASQWGWLQQRLAESRATWQVLGQQVLMARMTFPVSILRYLNPDNITPEGLAAAQKAISDYLTAKAIAAQNPAALTDEQKALLDPQRNPKLGYNLDAWDGYPAEREKILATARQLGKRLVVLAGDTHNAWASELTLQDGTRVGYEFATPGVSSPGLEEYLAALPPQQIRQIFLGVVDDLRYADTARRGFMLVTFTPSEARAQWFLLDTVKQRQYTVDSTAVMRYAPPA
ncbi:alkaline phosphatase D family protein [Tepidimonas sp.]|uniref:alkaline phosphatase D family protein n=1 Tax=Tepidimonas sp. TaxID=2002775 RepID=UPI0028CF427E|nr:alkaline phosphatase D family protein [Tepidimonas sp.]MDT7928655.1 alkaline phosphatase D family protein [Tepidimonas sp.]